MAKPLLGRRLAIASGQTELPIETVLKYRARWLSQGYTLPPLEHPEATGPYPEAGWRGLGDLVASGLSLIGIKKTEDCPCNQRQEKLNKLVPFKRKTD